MSYTELFTVNKKGDIESHSIFSNSHLGAALIWNIIANKYYQTNYYHIQDLDNPEAKFWKLAYQEDIPIYIKMVLFSTYDEIIIQKEDFPLLIQSFKEFYDKEFTEIDKENRNTGHLLEYIETIEKLISKRNILGIAWNQTSVNCNPWIYETEIEEDIENNIEYEYLNEPYNIFKGTKHSFVPLKVKT
jgi:hypothetical protein